jgi:DNA-binding NarL/FixJ family response regulator
MKKIKVILVDDHQIVRDGVKALLQNEPTITVIAEASDYEELENCLKTKIPDIILLDISLEGISGIEITKIVKQQFPEIRIIILSMYINEEFIINAYQAGASGYLAKNTTFDELVDAVKVVYDKGEYFSPMISNILVMSSIKNVKVDNKYRIDENLLTKREIEVLKLFAYGYSNKEISSKLFISSRTVESHKNHIMQKLEFKSQVEMLKFAFKSRLADL